jgi:hypothetical protein
MLNDCEIIRVLGVGVFGITCLAYDKLLEREVAIKEFFPRDFAKRNSKKHVVPKKGPDPELFWLYPVRIQPFSGVDGANTISSWFKNSYSVAEEKMVKNSV